MEYLPPLDASEVQMLRKALPGYQAIADDTSRLVEEHAATLHLSPAVLADIDDGLAEVKRLEPIELLLELCISRSIISGFRPLPAAWKVCTEPRGASANLRTPIQKSKMRPSSSLISSRCFGPARKGEGRGRHEA